MPVPSILHALCEYLVLGIPRVADAQTAETQGSDTQTRVEILRNERQAKRGELEPYEISSVEARLVRIQKLNFPRNIFVRGWNQFRPLIGGMPSGSGFVVGPGFVNGLDRENFDFEANARVSTRGFTTFDTSGRTFPPNGAILPCWPMRGPKPVTSPSCVSSGWVPTVWQRTI